ncbi:MAG: hypothetical protein ABIU95_04715 [Burkholderiales bacterium]
MTVSVLILGASYGSLLGTKLLMAGHRVSLVCTRPTADLINREGTVVRFPLRGRTEPVAIVSGDLPGALHGVTPDEVDPSAFDLVVLAMQEGQYGAPDVRRLMGRVAQARKACLAIMNMPPLPYLKRISGLDTQSLESVYADATVWDGFDPGMMSLASPDPQAFRPADQPKNVLQVGLPTNFKAARFEAEAPNALLQQLEADIDAARCVVDGEALEIPVRLKVHDSIFVPLAKWPMLLTGNYRCVRPTEMISIKEAVHGDLVRSRDMYNWATQLCIGLGAQADDLVPFDKYAQAAASLGKPSSAARALFAGAKNIERVDSLVKLIANQLEVSSDTLDEIVALVDARLVANRQAEERVVA